LRQLISTIRQISRSESVGTFEGICRHLRWQVRRVLRDFPCELPISNSRLHVDRATGVGALVNAMGEYDYNNMSFVKTLLASRSRSFVDVGANVGSYTLVASEASDARIVAVEPHPRTFALLAANVERNNRTNVMCLNVALFHRDGRVELTDATESCLNSLVLPREEVEAPTVQVVARRFDTVCRITGVIPDIVKIDVEGHQREVLDGFGELQGRVKVILIEGGEEPSVKAWMQEAEYSGPWFIHFNSRLLAGHRQRRQEDPVFVHSNFFPELQNLRFHFSDSPELVPSNHSGKCATWS
jgi:FkbM family methyltransferase